MTEKPTPQFHYAWSAICPNDLGLKVGLWSREDSAPTEFREVLGWVTIVGKDVSSPTPPENGFHAVILDDTMYPTIARAHPKYCAVFPKNVSQDEAKALAREWKPKEGAFPQPNMKGGNA